MAAYFESSNRALEDTVKPHSVGRIRRPIGLALQGGGSWGAYTWGVLDRLLASRTVSVTQLSGTSAGALNAAIVASALAQGSGALARGKLRGVWLAVGDTAAGSMGQGGWRAM